MSSRPLGLVELDDRVELEATIGGRTYRFSEVPLEKLADLDEFLRRTIKHPIQEILPHLKGLSDKDRASLLENARQEARNWPPRAGTSRGIAALMSTEEGQIEALAAGLSVHHPDLSRVDVERLYRRLQNAAVRDARAAKRRGETYDGEGMVNRIFSVISGFGDPELATEEGSIPEASAPGPAKGSTGGFSIVGASEN